MLELVQSENVHVAKRQLAKFNFVDEVCDKEAEQNGGRIRGRHFV